MSDEECWIPEITPCEDFAKWVEYEDMIYGLFRKDFIETKPTYNGKPVNVRKLAYINDRERAFYHVTCRNFDNSTRDEDRDPEPRRCERIRWIRAFIENSSFCDPPCFECEGVRLWNSPYRGSMKGRTKIYLRDEQFIVILEERENYCLLITSFYVDEEHTKRKLDKDFNKAIQKAQAPN